MARSRAQGFAIGAFNVASASSSVAWKIADQLGWSDTFDPSTSRWRSFRQTR
jgi:hypothetical protein